MIRRQWHILFALPMAHEHLAHVFFIQSASTKRKTNKITTDCQSCRIWHSSARSELYPISNSTRQSFRILKQIMYRMTVQGEGHRDDFLPCHIIDMFSLRMKLVTHVHPVCLRQQGLSAIQELVQEREQG